MTRETRSQSSAMRAHGFTLIELLVVVTILGTLVALLLPSLMVAREKGRAVACLSNMRQIHQALLIYAGDHNGWFPIVYWGAPNVFMDSSSGWCVDYNNSTWMSQYFPNPHILWCPGMDPRLTDSQQCPWTSSYYGKPGVFCTTYHIMAATSNRPVCCQPPYDCCNCPYPETANFFGWWTYAYRPDETDSYRAPCPNMRYLGTYVTPPSPCFYAPWGPIWIPLASQQAAVVDGFEPSGTWGPYYGYDFVPPRALNNHWRLGGENVVFLDGHGEWRTAAQVKQRFVYYGANWIWW